MSHTQYLIIRSLLPRLDLDDLEELRTAIEAMIAQWHRAAGIAGDSDSRRHPSSDQTMPPAVEQSEILKAAGCTLEESKAFQVFRGGGVPK